jgi:hypothetical protein
MLVGAAVVLSAFYMWINSKVGSVRLKLGDKEINLGKNENETDEE